MLTVNDALRDLTIDQALTELKSKGSNYLKIGGFTFGGGWFISNAFRALRSFRATEVCWVMIIRTEITKVKYERGAPVGFAVNWELKALTTSGGVYSLSLISIDTKDLSTVSFSPPKDISDSYNLLIKLCPWSEAGASSLADTLWDDKDGRSTFSQLITDRVKLIKSGLASGALAIQSDGSIQKVDASFLLPQLADYYKTWYTKFHARVDEQGASVRARLAEQEANIAEGKACASCGATFNWHSHPANNTTGIMEAHPEWRGKKICRMCAGQYNASRGY